MPAPHEIGPRQKNDQASKASGERTGADNREKPEDETEEPKRLGLLFFAAAAGLALLLTIVGLLAFAAMSRLPPDVLSP